MREPVRITLDLCSGVLVLVLAVLVLATAKGLGERFSQIDAHLTRIEAAIAADPGPSGEAAR